MTQRNLIVIAALCVLVVPAAGLARAEPVAALDETQAAFQKITDSLASGAYDTAIDNCELLSDKGYARPNLSFDRAVGYLLRAASPHRNPGDLGQAAAALEETLLFDTRDAEAQSLLDRLRYEISRERAKAGLDPVVSRPTLGRSVVALASEDVWALIAIAGSLLLTLGLGLRLWLKKTGAQIAGPTLIVIGGIVLTAGAGLCHSARSHRLDTVPGVVIADRAQLLNDQGLPLAAVSGLTNEVPEGARVDVLENRGRLARVAWGGSEAWVLSTQLRLLRQP